MLTDRDEMSNLYSGHSMDSSHHVSVHLAMQLQRRRLFKNQTIRKKIYLLRPCLITDSIEMGKFQPIRYNNWLWWACLLTNLDEKGIIYRGPSMDASYQVSVYLAMRFQRRRFFKNQTIRKKICLWRTCLMTIASIWAIFHRGPIKDASYQVSVHLVKQFQRRRFA